MWAQVTIRCADRAASERFYDLVLATLGLHRSATARSAWNEFTVAAASPQQPPTRRLHIGFRAPSRTEVDAFWRAGVEAGYRDDGAPGPRPQYTPDYYGAFLLDPDGNSAEAVHHGDLRGEDAIDHLWIRVADVPASARFYADVAARAGFRVAKDTAELARFRGTRGGSFTVLADGPPTQHVELAFPGGEGATLRDPDGNTVRLG